MPILILGQAQLQFMHLSMTIDREKLWPSEKERFLCRGEKKAGETEKQEKCNLVCMYVQYV